MATKILIALSPPRNELATWLAARSCVDAIVALPLFGMSALVAQTTNEADIGVSHLTEVVQYVNGNDALDLLPVGPGGELGRRAGSGPPEDPATCINCEHDTDQFGLYWHWTTGANPTPWEAAWNIGHGEHDWLLILNCDIIHGVCFTIPPPDGALQALNAMELTQGVSDAVAEHDVAALAGYAKISSVSLYANRSAIQVRGCDGETIVGHVPVNAALLAAVEAAVAQLDSEG